MDKAIFTKPLPSKEERVVGQIDTQVRIAAVALLTAYNQIRSAIYTNVSFRTADGTVDSDAVLFAFNNLSTTGLSSQQLGEAARIIKTVVNRFAPGTITDNVPEVTITLGE